MAAGVALGVVGRLSDGWPHAPRLLFALGAPWVLTALVVGALSPDRRRAAGAAAGALVISVGVYYAVMTFVEGRVGLGYALAMTVGWGGMAAVLGALFGVAGATLRRGSGEARSACAALVGGVFAGEAVLFLPRAETVDARVLLCAQLAVGVAGALAFAAPRWRARALALTASAAGAAFVVDALARVVMRRYGWGGH